MFSFFKKVKANADTLHAQALRQELKELAGLYPTKPLPVLSQAPSAFPRVTTLEPFGLAAYHLSLMPRASGLASLHAMIEREGFQHEVARSPRFLSLRNPADETLSMSEQPEFGGTTLILISNSTRLIDALLRLNLAPPAPWEVFPQIDPESLGSLQGNLEHWWNTYWLPFWDSLDDKAQLTRLDSPECPAGWREFIELHDDLNR